jgi:hypothetical protein
VVRRTSLIGTCTTSSGSLAVMVGNQLACVGILAAGEVRQWIGSLATVAAVVVALSLQLWLPYWRRPRIQMKLGTQPDVTADGKDVVGKWYDLRVENVGRGDVAREVEVVITRVLAVNDEEMLPTPVPHRALKWAHVDQGRSDIPAGFARGIMIGSAWPAEPENTDKPLRFEVGTFPRFAHSRRHVLLPGRYRFELSIVAANARSSSYVFDLVLGDDIDLKMPDGVQRP